MAGTNLFTKLAVRPEPTGYGSGTIENLESNGGRRLLVSPSGIISANLGEEWDLGADRVTGTRNPVILNRATLVGKNPELSFEAPAVPTDELPFYLSALQEAALTIDNGDTRTWLFELGGANSGEALSLQAHLTDGQQGFFANGIVISSLEIGAEASGLTTLSATAFAKDVVEAGAGSVSTLPTANIRSLAGRTWRAYTHNEFPFSVEPHNPVAFDYLYDWTLAIESGNGPINAQAGDVRNAGYNPYAAPFSATLSMTVGSTEATMDKFLANRGKPVYIHLANGDGGDPQHSLEIRLAGIVSSITPISGDQDGVTTYALEVSVALDPAWPSACIEIWVVNQLANLFGDAEVGS